MIDRILDLFRATAPLVDVAPALRALGVDDVTDLALVEYAVVGGGAPAGIAAWVEAWPFVPGLGKARWPEDPGEGRARIERLAIKGALARRADGGVHASAALLALVPGHPRLAGAGGAAAGALLDVDRAKLELASVDAPDAEVSPRLAAALLAIAARLAPLAAHDRAALDADLAASSTAARRIACAIAIPAAAAPASALGAGLASAVEHAVATLSPLAADAEGARVLDALRLLVLRFADALALDFDHAWIGGASKQHNLLRREELVRRFARWASLETGSAGAPEQDALPRLLAVDHRRESLFGEEAAHRARIGAEAQRRIDAEKKKRDDAAASYSSGRRE